MNWPKSRKLAVLKEYLSGVNEMEIFSKYGVTAPELREWQRAVETHGEGALRVTKLTKYRDKERM